MRNFGPTNPHGIAFPQEECSHQKEATGMENPKMYCSSLWKNPTFLCGFANYLVSWMAVRGQESLWYRDCTKAMVISKRSYEHGELNNVLPYSVQKQCLPVRGRKLPRLMGSSISSGMELCETLGLPIGMVLRSHKRYVYIKRKLRVWRTKKCIPLVRGTTPPTCSGMQITPFYGWQYRAENGSMRNFGPTDPHGTAFAPKQWL